MPYTIHYQLSALLLILISSCGGGSGSSSQNQSTCTGPCGVVKLVVKGSKSFNPNIEHGRIVTYHVTVTGEGIDLPVTAEFDGAATKGVIEGIPTGSNRKITVEAVNPNSIMIRQGETSGVSIQGGATANVEVTMESVPIFTNIADGNTIDNTRLIFQLFADPTSPVLVEDASGVSPSVLADVSTTNTEINLDTSTGLGRMSPALQSVGQHTYIVRNPVTGKSSAITVNLVDGTKRKGAPFVAAGANSSSAAQRRVSCGTH